MQRDTTNIKGKRRTGGEGGRCKRQGEVQGVQVWGVLLTHLETSVAQADEDSFSFLALRKRSTAGFGG